MLLDTRWEEGSCVYNYINAFPNKSYSLQIPPNTPSSVTLQQSPGEDGKVTNAHLLRHINLK